jgi:hypothetical protein
MSPHEIIAEARRCGAQLVVVDGRLKASPPGKLPEDLRAALRERVDEVKALLALEVPELNLGPERFCEPLPVRRCGALVRRICRVHSPSPHKPDCPLLRYEICRSRWYWLSPYRAIKCVGCETPTDLSIVEGWILGRETGEGEDGFGIPSEILSLLHIGGNL